MPKKEFIHVSISELVYTLFFYWKNIPVLLNIMIYSVTVVSVT